MSALIYSYPPVLKDLRVENGYMCATVVALGFDPIPSFNRGFSVNVSPLEFAHRFAITSIQEDIYEALRRNWSVRSKSEES